jgi:uncharacterized protein YbaP (TraB family)
MGMKRIRSIFIVGALLFIMGIFSGCRKTEEKSIFFWELSKPQNNHRIYLFGDLSFSKGGNLSIPKVVDDRFWKTKNLMLMQNAKSLTQEQYNQILMEYAIYQNEETLEDRIPKDLYQEFMEILKKHNIREEQSKSFKPWFATANLTVKELSNLGYRTGTEIEDYFVDRSSSKTVLELEPLRKQAEFFSQWDDALNALLIKDAIMATQNLQARSEKLLKDYEEGNIEGFTEGLFLNLSRDPSLLPLYEAVYFQKAKGFADQIDSHYKKGDDLFVYLSAGYLVSDKGILAKLEEMGYEVKRY